MDVSCHAFNSDQVFYLSICVLAAEEDDKPDQYRAIDPCLEDFLMMPKLRNTEETMEEMTYSPLWDDKFSVSQKGEGQGSFKGPTDLAPGSPGCSGSVLSAPRRIPEAKICKRCHQVFCVPAQAQSTYQRGIVVGAFSAKTHLRPMNVYRFLCAWCDCAAEGFAVA